MQTTLSNQNTPLRKNWPLAVAFLATVVFSFSVQSDLFAADGDPQLQALAHDFWQWRFVTQPATPDDILRVERPDGWQPDFSASALRQLRQQYTAFSARLANLDRRDWTRSDSVDYLCLRSAIERVNWELNVLKLPQRNPDFYVQQTLGALFELLLIHSPMTDQRIQNIITRLQSFPKTVHGARTNLTQPSAPFAKIALQHLDKVAEHLARVEEALKSITKVKFHAQLESATRKASAALVDYRSWLEERLPGMSQQFSAGRKAYEYFLKNIALMPYTPEELLQQGRLELNRAVAFETYESLRDRHKPKPQLFQSADEQIAREARDEHSIREFLETNDMMTVPDWLQHYTNEPIPPRVQPLRFMGVNDDLTSETRLNEPAVRYIPEPGPSLSYFSLASAYDPRPIIIHEGIPGHYYQLARSWKNPDAIRRRFVDSGPIEGIGLYVEELMLQFGLFDDRPHTREIIYNFMRLRALRVEVDVQLALGRFSIEQAAAYLARTVPMDKATATFEAGFFAYNPGQAISYQIGKLQILKFLSDAKMQLRDAFRLRDFHDYLMENGNVPIALLRWEYLGLDEEIGQFFEMPENAGQQ